MNISREVRQEHFSQRYCYDRYIAQLSRERYRCTLIDVSLEDRAVIELETYENRENIILVRTQQVGVLEKIGQM